MAQMLARNIENDVAERFKARAKAEGKSAEQVLRELIANYAERSIEEKLKTLDAIRETTRGQAVLDPVALIRQDRDTDHGRY